MPYTFEDSNVDNKLFTTNMASGGAKGKIFRFIAIEKGAILSRIKVWKEDWRIRGVQVWMSDDSTHLIGTKSGSSSEFVFQTGELITKLRIQASGGKSTGGFRRLGALYFETSKSRSWGTFSTWLEDEGIWWPDVGSGICCGIFGADGEDVDRLGFAMLRKVERSRLVEVKYPNLASEVVSKTPISSIQKLFKNDTDAAQTYTLKDKRTVSFEESWSTTFSLDWTLGFEVQAGIPKVGEFTASTSWTVSAETSNSASTATSIEQEFEWPVTAPARKNVEAKATIYSDEIDTDYTAKMELTLVNGAVYKYDRKGIYKGARSRSGVIEVTQLN